MKPHVAWLAALSNRRPGRDAEDWVFIAFFAACAAFLAAGAVGAAVERQWVGVSIVAPAAVVFGALFVWAVRLTRS